MSSAVTFAAALIMAGVHLFSERLSFLDRIPRSRWLSAAGGVSVAYVFVHLLPELSAHQATITRTLAGTALGTLERHVYILALLGLTVFYGLERLSRTDKRRRDKAGAGASTSSPVFALHIGSYALYNVLIGYLLVHREDPSLRGFVFYAAAMILHFVVNDRGLNETHAAAYRRVGRWWLAPAPLAGWALGMVTELPPVIVSGLFAFLAGSVVLNVLKEELPENRESRFGAFAAGAALYTILLLTF